MAFRLAGEAGFELSPTDSLRDRVPENDTVRHFQWGRAKPMIAALKRHWRFIHYRDQFESFLYMPNEKPPSWVAFHL